MNSNLGACLVTMINNISGQQQSLNRLINDTCNIVATIRPLSDIDTVRLSPHVSTDNYYVTFSLILDDDDNVIDIPITTSVAKALGLNANALYKRAKTSTKAIFYKSDDDSDLICATNDAGIYGASVIINDDFAARAQKYLYGSGNHTDRDFYIVFQSASEIALFNDYEDSGEIDAWYGVYRKRFDVPALRYSAKDRRFVSAF